MRELLASKRFIIALVTVAAEVAIHFGLDITPEKVEQLSSIVLALAGTLVVGYTATDSCKALGRPPGVGHKDE